MNRIIISDWSINNWPQFYLLLFISAFSIRLISCILRSLDYSSSAKEIIPLTIDSFIGIKDREGEKGDRWFPFMLGTLELVTYAFLINAGLWTGIGAWIALKTVAQWDIWKTHRTIFNRFLIGNALVIIFAFAFLAPSVSLTIVSAEQGAAANP